MWPCAKCPCDGPGSSKITVSARERSSPPVSPKLCAIRVKRGEPHAMKTMTCIEDLRQTYHRKVPRAFVDYCESGSYSEQTLRANRTDLERIKLRQRILHD